MADSSASLSEGGKLPEQIIEKDIPDLYIAREAYAYRFNQEMNKRVPPKELDILKGKNNIKRFWYKGQENEQILWAEIVGDNQDGDFLVVGNSNNDSEAALFTNLHVTNIRQRFQVNDFLDFVARVAPTQNKLSAIQRLSQVVVDSSFEQNLVQILADTVKDSYGDINFKEITTMRQLKLLVAQRKIEPVYWTTPQVDQLHFNLLPHIKSPIPQGPKEEVYDTMRTRLQDKVATYTPDRNYLENKTTFLGVAAEFVNTADIEGAVQTPHYWSDILEDRNTIEKQNKSRTASALLDLVDSFQQGDFFNPEGNEVILWRVKQTPDDTGKLYVMEGNHRVALLKALEVSKLPVLVKTVLI